MNDVSVGVVGPKNNDTATDTATDAATDVTAKEVLTREQLMQMIVELCVTPHSRDELMQQCGSVSYTHLRAHET